MTLILRGEKIQLSSECQQINMKPADEKDEKRLRLSWPNSGKFTIQIRKDEHQYRMEDELSFREHF